MLTRMGPRDDDAPRAADDATTRRRRAPSVRVRLALWHAGFLALLVCALAVLGVRYVDARLRARVDEELADAAHLVAGALDAQAARAAGGVPDHGAALRAVRAGRIEVLLVDPAAGRVVAAHTPDEGARRALLAAAAERGAGPLGVEADTTPFTMRDPVRGERRVLVRPHEDAGRAGDLLLVVARDLDDVRALVADLVTAAAAALLLAVPAAVLFGWLLARRSLAPVLAMSAQAERFGAAAVGAGGVAAGGAAPRLRAPRPDDELGRLAAVFNALLDRLADTLAQQRQFMADASHELRTPAAVVRSAAEVALRREDRTPAEYRAALELAQGEAERMSRLVDDLFLLARADATQPALRVEAFYLADTLAECARALGPAAEARGVTLLTPGGAPDDTAGDSAGDALDGAPCRGDEALVRRLVLNLAENALRFTPAGGRVTLRLAPDGLARDAARRDTFGAGPASVRPAWRVEVEDTGVGVPAAYRERIFERFFHTDAHAPGAGRGGAGLGLAMARTIAEAHGGRLVLARSDATGSLFVLVLPQDGPEGAAGADD